MTGRRPLGRALAALGAALLGGGLLRGPWAAADTVTAAPPVIAAAAETLTLAVDGMT
jgi:hypothetical protein